MSIVKEIQSEIPHLSRREINKELAPVIGRTFSIRPTAILYFPGAWYLSGSLFELYSVSWDVLIVSIWSVG